MILRTALSVLGVFAIVIAGAWLFIFRTPVETAQIGYRGVAMEAGAFTSDTAALVKANVVPATEAPYPPAAEKASQVYENVTVLGDVDADNFNRIMAAITERVSPEQGCAYCHGEDGNFASDDLYTKVVARRMLQMTQHINSTWSNHVGAVGVTCYTCHRGNPVPKEIWFEDRSTMKTTGLVGWSAGQNRAGKANVSTAMLTDPFHGYLQGQTPIRVASGTPLPTGNEASIQTTEGTYSLMMHMSDALGVNCTYCHNSRNFKDWNESPAARGTAFHGIRMARDLNNQYLDSLAPVYPPERLGPLGDAPKANCKTCHQGANKPLLGVSMLTNFPELAAPGPSQ